VGRWFFQGGSLFWVLPPPLILATVYSLSCAENGAKSYLKKKIKNVEFTTLDIMALIWLLTDGCIFSRYDSSLVRDNAFGSGKMAIVGSERVKST